jgi:hypothetical protein
MPALQYYKDNNQLFLPSIGDQKAARMTQLSDEELITRLQQEVCELWEKQLDDPVIRRLRQCNRALEYEILRLRRAKNISKVLPHGACNDETISRPTITDCLRRAPRIEHLA